MPTCLRWPVGVYDSRARYFRCYDYAMLDFRHTPYALFFAMPIQHAGAASAAITAFRLCFMP